VSRSSSGVGGAGATRQALIGLGAIAVVLVVVAVLAASGNRAQGLRADILSARRTEPGTTETFTISVRDTAGKVRSVEVDFGDGRVEELDVGDEPCTSPLSRGFDVDHAFDFTGYSSVTAVVVTGGCGAKTERVEAIRTIEVRTVRRE
jgi:hypothetical protein